MWALMIVEMKVALQRREQVRSAGKVAGVDELVLQTAPQTFDENVVQSAAASVLTLIGTKLASQIEQAH